MQNVISISFFHYEGPRMFGLLTSTNPSSPPFPHLERVMVLGPEPWLREMVKTIKDMAYRSKLSQLEEGPGCLSIITRTTLR